MNSELVNKVIGGLQGQPVLLALVVVNVITLVGFAFVLNEVSNAMERREELIKSCFERRP